MTRTAAAFTAALCIHILILRTNPGWRLAGMPWSEPESAGITVRIVSKSPIIEQGDVRIEPDPTDTVDSRTKTGSRSVAASIATAGQPEVIESPVVIRPEQAIKKAPEVFASEAIDAFPAASDPLSEKTADPRQENSIDGRQRNNVAVQSPAATGRDFGSPVIRTATPLYRKNPPPAYPGLARKRGYEGTTILRVLVNETGLVDTVRVATSSGYELLDKAALQAIAGWSFAPATRNDRPVTMWVMIPVRFALQ